MKKYDIENLCVKWSDKLLNVRSAATLAQRKYSHRELDTRGFVSWFMQNVTTTLDRPHVSFAVEHGNVPEAYIEPLLDVISQYVDSEEFPMQINIPFGDEEITTFIETPGKVFVWFEVFRDFGEYRMYAQEQDDGILKVSMFGDTTPLVQYLWESEGKRVLLNTFVQLFRDPTIGVNTVNININREKVTGHGVFGYDFDAGSTPLTDLLKHGETTLKVVMD